MCRTPDKPCQIRNGKILAHRCVPHRTGLIESLLPENGEKPFAVLTRKVIKEEMKARTPSQAGNLLSGLRGMIRWMIDPGHLDDEKRSREINELNVDMVRSEGLEPPRFYSLPPQGSASTNSATSAWDTG
jgi:hypothetical protein